MGRGAGPKSQPPRLAIRGRTSLRNGSNTQGTMQLMEGTIEVREFKKIERRKKTEKERKRTEKGH